MKNLQNKIRKAIEKEQTKRGTSGDELVSCSVFLTNEEKELFLNYKERFPLCELHENNELFIRFAEDGSFHDEYRFLLEDAVAELLIGSMEYIGNESEVREEVHKASDETLLNYLAEF